MCDVMQALRLKTAVTTYRIVCFDISRFYSTWEGFGCKLQVNDKKWMARYKTNIK